MLQDKFHQLPFDPTKLLTHLSLVSQFEITFKKFVQFSDFFIHIPFIEKIFGNQGGDVVIDSSTVHVKGTN